MSIVAISETLGSLGDEIGRELAQSLSYGFADREIISKAAERFGEEARVFYHLTEEKPTLWERLVEAQQHYRTYVEAIVWEMAARENVVLVGRGSVFVLQQVRQCLRVRITAPESLRARRIEQREGLAPETALHRVRQSDRELAARVRFLYGVDWDDPLLYDLVINTERMGVAESLSLMRDTLGNERFRTTSDSRAALKDLSLVALARATLLANPITRVRPILVSCSDGVIVLQGTVDSALVWETAEEAVGRIPGVAGVKNEITVVGYPEPTSGDELSHDQYLHGEARSWGGYSEGWYMREWQALHRYRAARREKRGM